MTITIFYIKNETFNESRCKTWYGLVIQRFIIETFLNQIALFGTSKMGNNGQTKRNHPLTFFWEERTSSGKKMCISKRDTTSWGHYNSKTKQGFAIWPLPLSPIIVERTPTPTSIPHCGRGQKAAAAALLLVFALWREKRPDVAAFFFCEKFSPPSW